MKIKQILIFAIAILLSTYAFFKFISFKKSHLSLNSHLTNNSQSVVFNVQSEFGKYSIKDNSIDEELFNNIADELKLNTQGWCQFDTFDLVHPNKVEFIFADINLLSKQEQQQLLNKSINNDQEFIAGIKSNFNQTTKILTYSLYTDGTFLADSPNLTSIASYWSRKIVRMLCSCNNTLNKNNKINSKYQDIVEQFNLEFQSLFKINNNQTSFFHSLLQKINIVQPVFADCSGKWECAPKLNHWVCEDNYSRECIPEESDYCGLGIECINRHTCDTNDSSFYNCNGTTLDACYSESCPTEFCDPYQSTCYWDPGAPPVIPPACGDGWCDVEGDEGCGNCEVDCGACVGGDTNCDCCFWGGEWNDGTWCGTANQCFVSKNPHGCENGYSVDGSGYCQDFCGTDPGHISREGIPYDTGECPVINVQCYMCDCYKEPVPPPPPPVPIGYIDDFDCDTNTLYGWACDGNNWWTALTVYVYLDGNFIGSETANKAGEAGVAQACGNVSDENINHGFAIQLPPLIDAQDYNIKVVAGSLINGAWNKELGNSPLPVNCPYPICGTILDDEGEPINNLKIGVKDGNAGVNYEYTTTNANGFFTISNWIASNGLYRVDPIEADFPLKYLPPPQSTTDSYSWINCDINKNVDLNSPTYECQQMGNNDCSGPNESDEKCRCNFTIPRNTVISGGFYLDPECDAAVNVSTGLCEDNTSTPLNLSGIASITADSFTGTIDESVYTIDTLDWQDSATITLDLTSQSDNPDNPNAYACSCPDTNPWLCTYESIPSPSEGINFYLKNYNLSHDPWLQIYGSNMYAAANINIQIPDICNDGTNYCQDAIILKDLNSTLLSSGFPLVGGATVENQTKIHLADDRDLDTAQYAFAVNTSLPTYSFEYFNDKIDDQLQDYEEDSIANVANDTTAYFIKDSSLNLDITTPIDIADNKKIIILINGDLEINDSDIIIDELIKVESGSILMFVVSGDIIFNANVGYSAPSLYPDDVFSNPASNPANIEGIYIADGKIIIQSNNDSAASDKKFIGAGTFVANEGFTLDRDYSDDTIGKAWNNTNPTETFIYRPDFVVNFPDELKDFLSNWREVNPSW